MSLLPVVHVARFSLPKGPVVGEPGVVEVRREDAPAGAARSRSSACCVHAPSSLRPRTRENDVVRDQVGCRVPERARRDGAGAAVLGAGLPPSPVVTLEDVNVPRARPRPDWYSAASTPMRLRRHSSVSAPPVEMAMFGMSPSAVVLRQTAAMLVGHAGCPGTARRSGATNCWRHLPICTTSGMFVPSGTFVERELAGRVGERRRDRIPGSRASARVAGGARRKRAPARVRNVDDDVVERIACPPGRRPCR